MILLCATTVPYACKANVRSHMFWQNFWGSCPTNLWKIIFCIHWGQVHMETQESVTAAPISQTQARMCWGKYVNIHINWYMKLRLTYKTESWKGIETSRLDMLHIPRFMTSSSADESTKQFNKLYWWERDKSTSILSPEKFQVIDLGFYLWDPEIAFKSCFRDRWTVYMELGKFLMKKWTKCNLYK